MASMKHMSCTGEQEAIFLLRRPTPASQRALQSAAGVADGDQAKVSALLSCACVLAAATAGAAAADERAQQLCAPLFAALRTVAARRGTTSRQPAVALADVALRRLRTVATHAGGAQPGLLGALAADWVAFRAVARARCERRSKAPAALCGFLADALACGGGAAPPLVDAVAQLSAELLRGGGGGGEAARPPPFVLAPLAAAVDRGAAARRPPRRGGGGRLRPAVDAAVEETALSSASTPPSPSSSRSSPRRHSAQPRAARRRRVGGGAR